MAAKGDQTKCALFPEPVWKSDLSRMQGRGGTFLRKSRRGRAEKLLDLLLYFCNYRNMKKPDPLLVARSADRFAALGAPPRLEIVRLLLSAHPAGMVAGEVQEELEIPASTLSHHLEKLKQVGLVNVRRVGTFLWYSANKDALREVLGFLYEECCTRSRAVAPESFVQISR
jgi:ArsR family transcriptional regulator, arsenate/arsenite/antimonite-responsive transcriptional repressor